MEGFYQNLLVDYYFTIMEFCDGGDLEDFIKGHDVKEELMPVYLRMFSEMAEAIAYLHDKKHFHRDLKPANVLLMFPTGSKDFKDLIIKVGDFGFTKNL